MSQRSFAVIELTLYIVRQTTGEYEKEIDIMSRALGNALSRAASIAVSTAVNILAERGPVMAQRLAGAALTKLAEKKKK